MKFSIKFLTLSLLFFFGVSAAQAQTASEQPDIKKERKERADRGERAERTPAQMAERQTERLAKHVTLTDRQLTRVNAVHLEYANKMATLRGSGEDREQSRAAHQALRTEQEAAINRILTKDQVAQLEAQKAEMKDKRGSHEGGKKGEGRKGKSKDSN